ncbi:MAG: porin [Ignavibacteria bacterium]|nr:porin [Ignavibacteria bacterium]
MKILINSVLILIVGMFCISSILAQEQSNGGIITANPLTISGYVETYYSYDFGAPANHERPSFIYSFNKHNEFNLNIGFVKAKYLQPGSIRGTLALMAGTYAQYNLSSEQGLLKNVFEANVGACMYDNSEHNIWVDAGIMPSHIGFESAIGQDCWNLTRSILADNSPYYEAGIKVGYTTSDDKWYLAAMYLNGWQRITKVNGNQTPAFGSQITYKPSTDITLNWSTYIGNEQPDTVALWRYFNNFYGIFQLTDKIGLTAGFDLGLQDKFTDSTDMNLWFSPVVIVQYKPTNSWKIAARGEFYSDEYGVIIPTGTPNGFQTFGFSLNVDYYPGELHNVLLRTELRTLQSKDEVFLSDNKPSTSNTFFTTSLSLAF